MGCRVQQGPAAWLSASCRRRTIFQLSPATSGRQAGVTCHSLQHRGILTLADDGMQEHWSPAAQPSAWAEEFRSRPMQQAPPWNNAAAHAASAGAASHWAEDFAARRSSGAPPALPAEGSAWAESFAAARPQGEQWAEEYATAAGGPAQVIITSVPHNHAAASIM